MKEKGYHKALTTVHLPSFTYHHLLIITAQGMAYPALKNGIKIFTEWRISKERALGFAPMLKWVVEQVLPLTGAAFLVAELMNCSHFRQPIAG
jgi:hypothetical protein